MVRLNCHVVDVLDDAGGSASKALYPETEIPRLRQFRVFRAFEAGAS